MMIKMTEIKMARSPEEQIYRKSLEDILKQLDSLEESCQANKKEMLSIKENYMKGNYQVKQEQIALMKKDCESMLKDVESTIKNFEIFIIVIIIVIMISTIIIVYNS